jgi:hypothetical protein
MRQRLQAKLREVKAELTRRRHHPIPAVGTWLRSVVEGHLRYYGVPTNRPALQLFRFQVGRLWHGRCRGAARTATSSGTGCGGFTPAGCPLPVFVTPILCGALA